MSPRCQLNRDLVRLFVSAMPASGLMSGGRAAAHLGMGASRGFGFDG